MTDMREELAKHVYASMAWAYEDGSGNICPAWVKRGNSFAQDEARKRADAIIAALPSMVKPLEWHKSHSIDWDGDFHTIPTTYTIRGLGNEDYKLAFAGVFFLCTIRQPQPKPPPTPTTAPRSWPHLVCRNRRDRND